MKELMLLADQSGRHYYRDRADYVRMWTLITDWQKQAREEYLKRLVVS